MGCEHCHFKFEGYYATLAVHSFASCSCSKAPPRTGGNWSLHDARTSTTMRKQTRPAQRDIGHLIEDKLRNLYGQRNHVDQPLCHDDLKDFFNEQELWEDDCHHNLHERTCTTRTTGTSATVSTNNWGMFMIFHNQDNGDQLLRKDRDVDDHG